jgi:DNA-binding winged helix-turn-helix (wHTH) protein
MDGSGNGRGSVGFRFAEYELDIDRQELRRTGQVVPIEPQVFDVLVCLVRNHDRIVSKDELIDAVWQGRVISDTALSSRISAARRAIGDNGGEQRLIRTAHKRGFRFVGHVEKDTVPASATGESRPVAAAVEAGMFARNAVDMPALALPDKPSIAVLPFQNMSGAIPSRSTLRTA